jgi:peptide/nickel transport system substrate-binding protein
MDDINYPEVDGVNVLEWGGELPWPDWYAFGVYQPLVGANLSALYGQGNVQYLPGLAANWTVSPDARTYTLNLRQGINFSNGDPFNAYQVWAEEYGWYYLSANSSGFWQSYTIFNMSTSNFGPATIALMNQSGGVENPSSQLLSIEENNTWPIYVTGPYTIVFHLQAPFLWFLGTLVSYVGLTYDVQFVFEHGGFGAPASLNTYFNTNPVPGTGPYTITDVSTNAFISFQQDPNYWGNSLTAAQIAANPVLDPGHVKKIIVKYVPDDLARYTDISTGAAQIVAITSQDWNLVLANPNKYSYLVLPPWAGFSTDLSLNTNEYPTNITAVRQAIVRAINYTDLADKSFFGEVTPTMGPEYPAWSNLYDLGNYTPYQYNLTQAQDILKNAGINTANFPTLTFYTETTSVCAFCTNVAQVVQSDLANLGITVNIELVSGNTWASSYGPYSYNVAHANQTGQITLLGGGDWAPSAQTPADDWVSFVSNESAWGNFAGYYQPDVQACVNAMTTNNNLTYIQGLCKIAQGQIYNDAPYGWLGWAKLFDLAGSIVWQTGVVKSFYTDPVWGGMTTMPLINTVTFG